MLDLNRIYTTRDGRPVILSTRHVGYPYPIHGVMRCPNGVWEESIWTAYGVWSREDNEFTHLDLMPAEDQPMFQRFSSAIEIAKTCVEQWDQFDRFKEPSINAGSEPSAVTMARALLAVHNEVCQAVRENPCAPALTRLEKIADIH